MDECAICGNGGQDHRTLRLGYFYDLSEISNKLQVGHAKGDKEAYRYAIRTCKDCRGDFLSLLRDWCEGQFVTESHSSGDRDLTIRRDGRTMFITREEWEESRGHTND